MVHPLRDQVIELRLSGKSYSEITAITGVNKSTISYMVRKILLTEGQQQRLDAKRLAASSMLVSSCTAESRIRGGVACWHKHKAKHLVTLANGRHQGNLRYLPEEMPILEKLQSIYGCSFSKCFLMGCYFDFANGMYLIEHSYDSGKGLSSIIKRFSKVTDDSRIKIAYVNRKFLGPIRLSRLVALGVDVHSISELE